jgi:hypothetical protein
MRSSSPAAAKFAGSRLARAKASAMSPPSRAALLAATPARIMALLTASTLVPTNAAALPIF